MKHGQDSLTEFHQTQDIIVITTVVNVVYGQYRKVVLLQYLNYGAVVHLEQQDVAVCKVCQATQADMLLNQHL